jgi:hypothetical protein
VGVDAHVGVFKLVNLHFLTDYVFNRFVAHQFEFRFFRLFVGVAAGGKRGDSRQKYYVF